MGSALDRLLSIAPRTPNLIADLDGIQANLSSMATWAANAPCRLRPDISVHHCVPLAQLQAAAAKTSSASVASLTDCEAVIEAGFSDVLITRPIVTQAQVDRLRKIARSARVTVT